MPVAIILLCPFCVNSPCCMQDVFEAADHVAEDVFRDAQEDIGVESPTAESPTADYHEAGKCQAKTYVQQ